MAMSDALEGGVGVYSITIQSNFDGFCGWYSVSVERSPDSEYTAPEGMILANSSETVSGSGVAILETYMPQFVLDLQKVILVDMTGKGKTPDGPSEGSGVLTQTDMLNIAVNVLDIGYVFSKLLTAVGAAGTVSMAGATQETFTQIGELFRAPPHLVSQMLQIRRLTPAVIMQTIYAGLGIVVIQKEEGFMLTDEVTCMKSVGISVEAETVVSIRGSFDTTRIKKETIVNLTSTGAVGEKSAIGDNSVSNFSILNSVANEKNKLNHRALPGAGISNAVGMNAIMTMESIPLLQAVDFNAGGMNIDGDTATVKMGDDEITVPLLKIKKAKDRMIDKDIKDIEEDVDVGAAAVAAKTLLIAKMQEMMGLRAIMGASAKTAVVDATAIGFYEPLTISGGEISLQKAIITSEGVETAVEEGNIGDQGFITGVTVTAHAGLITSSINYVSLEKAYEGIF